MTISFVDFRGDDADEPTDAYWAVVERISLASRTYTHENASPLQMASTLRLALDVNSDGAPDQNCWHQTG